jgi:N-acetylneuraminate lyase
MKPLNGLIAATFTPMDDHGAVDLTAIPATVEALRQRGVQGVYVCGSTGEGPSLTTEERMTVAEAYVQAAEGIMPTVIQVGHNSVEDARHLATHAAQIGADGISAVPPNYFMPDSLTTLVETMAHVADAAPETPFYYYHIPVMSGIAFDMPEFLETASARIPTLAGLKFSSRDLDLMQLCKKVEDGRFTVLFGVDEMLLSGLVAGCDGAVGSTYNFMGPLFRTIMGHYEAGDLPQAQERQGDAIELIRIMIRHGGLPALKAVMTLSGVPSGPTRLPLKALSANQIDRMGSELDALGFFEIVNGGIA